MKNYLRYLFHSGGSAFDRAAEIGETEGQYRRRGEARNVARRRR